jgi:hypothetical protein
MKNNNGRNSERQRKTHRERQRRYRGGRQAIKERQRETEGRETGKRQRERYTRGDREIWRAVVHCTNVHSYGYPPD